jgi:hypothetical protein
MPPDWIRPGLRTAAIVVSSNIQLESGMPIANPPHASKLQCISLTLSAVESPVSSTIDSPIRFRDPIDRVILLMLA